MRNRVKFFPYVPDDIQGLTVLIAKSVHAIPDNVMLNFNIIYPATGSQSQSRWMLVAPIDGEPSRDPKQYLEFIRQNGFGKAEIKAVFDREGKRYAEFLLRDATTPELMERV